MHYKIGKKWLRQRNKETKTQLGTKADGNARQLHRGQRFCLNCRIHIGNSRREEIIDSKIFDTLKIMWRGLTQDCFVLAKLRSRHTKFYNHHKLQILHWCCIHRRCYLQRLRHSDGPP